MEIPIDYYKSFYDKMVIKPEKVREVKEQCAKIQTNKQKYVDICNKFSNGIDWRFIGLIHSLECNLSFSKHLHNGDSLQKRTVNIPIGRPLGNPPFTFMQSAIDLIQLKKWDKIKDWNVYVILQQLEKNNGFGYYLYHKDIANPYLWSYTTFYTKGKYESDGKFKKDLVSKQPGCGPLLYYLK